MIPRLAVIENVCTLALFAVVVIFAPGHWKWMALCILSNLNYRTK